MTLEFFIFTIYCAVVPFIQVLGSFVLLLVRIPTTPELRVYSRARKVMALAYLIFGLSGGMQLLVGGENLVTDLFVCSLMWLLIASIESFLVSYGIVVLLDAQAFSRRSLCLNALLISFFVLLAICSLLTEDPLFRKILFPFFLLFYICQLIFYTRLFLLKYKQYMRNAENYFSGNEIERLRWLKVSFFSFFAIGILALIPMFYVNYFLAFVLSILFAIFYVYLLLKYMNYPYTFYVLAPVFEIAREEQEVTEQQEGANRTQISIKLEKWIQKKKYCGLGVTISTLASDLGVGRNNLSAYINNHEKMNFNAWVNHLRVNESKVYLAEQPEMSISDIAHCLGYSDISTFSRHFKTIEGVSPLKWRSKQTVLKS